MIHWRVAFACAAAGLIALAGCGDDDDDTGNTGGRAGSVAAGGAGAGGTGGRSGGGGAGAGGATGGTGGATAGTGGTTGEGGEGGIDGEGGEGGAPADLSDAQILEVTDTANLGEITQANTALEKLNNQRVRLYATRMVGEHTAGRELGVAVADAIDVTPVTSPTAQQLEAESNAIVQQLFAATEAQIDVLYMQTQVTAHRRVLELIEDQLLPSASAPDLVTYLHDMHHHVEDHLEDAEALLDQITPGP